MGDRNAAHRPETAQAPRLNALVMDGGGVRGLSSLLILQRLMNAINESLYAQGYKGNYLEVRDIFRFAAGTSTGGLIAIMLTKLNMSIEECIEEYRTLSKVIFGKKRIRGKLSGGLYRARYRGGVLRNCMRKLLREKGLNEDELLMWNQSESQARRMDCSVVCREHENKSKFSELKDDEAYFCSISCGHDFKPKICDAARATSAAWTYFPLMPIQGRFFADGGIEYNNPSFALWEHYTVDSRTKRSRNQYNPPTDSRRPVPTHPGLDFSRCRIVNIGTGSKTVDTPPREREKLASFIPTTILFGMFLKETLTKVATASERAADTMRTLASKDLLFHRLSATNGVCWIKLDKYQQLDEISRLTNEWLNDRNNSADISKLASDIATEYLAARPIAAATAAP